MAIYIGDKEITLGYLGDIALSDITQPRSAICGECKPYLTEKGVGEKGLVVWTSCYDGTTTFQAEVATSLNQTRFWSSTYPIVEEIPGFPNPDVIVQELTLQGWDSNPCTVFGTPLNCEQYTLKTLAASFMYVDYYNCSSSQVENIALSVSSGYSSTATICAQSGSFSLLAGVTISGSIVPC